jgi:protein O-mannosyl-transferase
MKKNSSKQNQIPFYENIKRWPLLIFIVVFLVFGNTVFNKYALDDEFVIKSNSQVMKGLKGIPDIITSQYFQNKSASFGYRPITKISFAIEYEIFSSNPAISHLINILLYAISCVILFKLLIKILLEKTGPVFIFIVTLIWIIHPLHTEVVASLKNREELLYFTFSLLSLRFFIHYIEKHKIYYLFSALLLYALSFLTKQSAISFALIIPLVLWFMYIKAEPFKQLIKNNVRLIVSVVCLFILAYVIYKLPLWIFPPDKIELLSFENPLRFEHSTIAKLSLAAYSLLIDLKLLFIPHPLVFYYGQFTIPDVHITDFLVIFSLLLHATILFLTIKYLRKKTVLVFGVLFYYLGILPFCNYFTEINGIVAERFLFAPSIGFAIAFTYLIFILTKNKIDITSFKPLSKSLKYLIIFVVIVFSIKSIARNTSWKDSETLYRNDIQYLGKSVKANDILAQELMDKIVRELPLKKPLVQLKPTLDSIILFYNQSLSLFPNNPKAMNNVANIYLNFYNQPDKALGYIQRAYTFRKNSFEISFNLAQCYEMLKQDTNAAIWYNKANKIDPSFSKTWFNLINIYYKIGMPDSAKITCETMLKYDTTTEIPYVGLGYYHILKKDTIRAVKYWEKAFKKNPQNYERAMSLYNYFKIKNDTVKAKYYYEKAVEAKMFQQK